MVQGKGGRVTAGRGTGYPVSPRRIDTPTHMLVTEGEDMDKGQVPEHHGGFPRIRIEDTVLLPGGRDGEDEGSYY